MYRSVEGGGEGGSRRFWVRVFGAEKGKAAGRDGRRSGEMGCSRLPGQAEASHSARQPQPARRATGVCVRPLSRLCLFSSGADAGASVSERELWRSGLAQGGGGDESLSVLLEDRASWSVQYVLKVGALGHGTVLDEESCVFRKSCVSIEGST